MNTFPNSDKTINELLHDMYDGSPIQGLGDSQMNAEHLTIDKKPHENSIQFQTRCINQIIEMNVHILTAYFSIDNTHFYIWFYERVSNY